MGWTACICGKNMGNKKQPHKNACSYIKETAVSLEYHTKEAQKLKRILDKNTKLK